jgi:hypothetical protein
MPDPWPACGHALLNTDADGWLRPGDDWLRLLLARPELALVEESCPAERSLHESLQAAPSRTVPADALAAIRDADARENVRVFLAFRDALHKAGTLEAWLLGLFRSGHIDTPPVFIDLVVQAVVRHLLDDGTDNGMDAFELRAAELLFRPQRISLQQGRVLAGDRDVLDLQNETQGFGELGRLLAQAEVQMKPLELQVLDDDNAGRCLAEAARPVPPGRPAPGSRFLLDLTPEIRTDLGHGLSFTMNKARSGPKALAGVLQKWLRHLLGVVVQIRPVPRIDDSQWRWHVGLDAEASALLNDLYEGREVDADRQRRLINLYRLDFDNPAEMRPDIAGRPVYLGLMMNTEQVLRVKPQNLLLNLPLAGSS